MEVFVDQSEGNRLKVADMVPGSFFGEKSLLTGENRSATIICATESIVCEITKSCISELMQKNTDVEKILSRAVMERELRNDSAMAHATKEEIEESISTAVSGFLQKMKCFFNQDNSPNKINHIPITTVSGVQNIL